MKRAPCTNGAQNNKLNAVGGAVPRNGGDTNISPSVITLGRHGVWRSRAEGRWRRDDEPPCNSSLRELGTRDEYEASRRGLPLETLIELFNGGFPSGILKKSISFYRILSKYFVFVVRSNLSYGTSLFNEFLRSIKMIVRLK